MKKKLKKKIELYKSIGIILNMLLILFGLLGFIESVKLFGKFDLKYYTQDSNLLAIFVEMLFLYFIIVEEKAPKWLAILKYIATLSLTITFVVVLLILIPINGFDWKFMLFGGPTLYYHTLCPLIAIISFIFFENYSFNKKDITIAMSFTFCYAIVAIVLNLLGRLVGPYPFLEILNNPWYETIMWLFIIIGGAFGLSYLLFIIKNKYNKYIQENWK